MARIAAIHSKTEVMWIHQVPKERACIDATSGVP
jgi:hypothetical protein